MSAEIPDTADAAALRRVIERLSQRLREIERARALPTLRKELAAALGVHVSTVSRWYTEGLPRGSSPEETTKWLRDTLRRKRRRRKHRDVRK